VSQREFHGSAELRPTAKEKAQLSFLFDGTTTPIFFPPAKWNVFGTLRSFHATLSPLIRIGDVICLSLRAISIVLANVLLS
jgi:hypothetical protein